MGVFKAAFAFQAGCLYTFFGEQKVRQCVSSCSSDCAFISFTMKNIVDVVYRNRWPFLISIFLVSTTLECPIDEEGLLFNSDFRKDFLLMQTSVKTMYDSDDIISVLRPSSVNILQTKILKILVSHYSQ